MKKKLYRSKKDKIIGGVCGGFGEYFDIDPIIFRIAWVAILFAGIFPGLIAYIIAWIIIQQNPSQTINSPEGERKNDNACLPENLPQQQTLENISTTTVTDDLKQPEQPSFQLLSPQIQNETEEKKVVIDNNKPVKGDAKSDLMTGVILVVIGILFLISNLFPYFNFYRFWPVILIIIGIIMLTRKR